MENLEPGKVPVIVVERGPHRGAYLRKQDATSREAVERLTSGLVRNQNERVSRATKTLLEMLAGRLRIMELTEPEKATGPHIPKSVLIAADEDTWAFMVGLVIVEQAVRIDL